MSHETLDPVAKYLLSSAHDTKEFSLEFKLKHDMPPTVMSQRHYLRSVLQAKLARDDAYELSARRVEFGRIEFTDRDLNMRFLLKSSAAFAIEQQMEMGGQLAFFPVPAPSLVADLQIIVFDLGRTELTFATAPAMEVGSKKQVRVVGQLVHAGRWPIEEADIGETTLFDQDVRDRFDELGGENEEGSDDR